MDGGEGIYSPANTAELFLGGGFEEGKYTQRQADMRGRRRRGSTGGGGSKIGHLAVDIL